MGLLDSILRRATNRVVNAAADKVVDQVVDNIRNAGSSNSGKSSYSQGNSSQNSCNQQSSSSDYNSFQDDSCDAAECRKRILSCLSANFSSYTVQEEVASSSLGERGGMPYSIVISQGSSIKLIIMIIGKATCQTRKYRFSKEAAAKNGVTMINFIGHYPNKPDYILNRLREYL